MNEKNKTDKVEDLPEGWKRVRLGEVIEIFDSKRIPLDEEYRSNVKGEFPYCGATGIIDYINDYIFDGEFVLIAEDGGKFNCFEDTAYLMTGKFWANNHVHIIFGKANFLNNAFLKYFINYEDVSSYISGSTREKLNQQLLKNILIPLPSLPEQQKIAGILETVDNVIEKTDAIIEKYKRIKQGLMEDLLTGKVRVVSEGESERESKGEGGKFSFVKNQKWKSSPIGRIPDEWKIIRLSEVVRKIVDNRGKTAPTSEDGIELIETYCITDKANKYPDLSKIRNYVDRYIYRTWFRSGHPEVNDILVATVGENVGASVIMNVSRGCIAQNLVALKLKENFNPDFIYYLFISKYFDGQMFSVLMTAAQPSLKLPHLLSFLFPLPPLPEQQHISEILSQADAVIEEEQAYKEKLERLKRGLMEDLLTGKVRVKVRSESEHRDN